MLIFSLALVVVELWAAKHIWDPCCHLLAEAGFWFILINGLSIVHRTSRYRRWVKDICGHYLVKGFRQPSLLTCKSGGFQTPPTQCQRIIKLVSQSKQPLLRWSLKRCYCLRCLYASDFEVHFCHEYKFLFAPKNPFEWETQYKIPLQNRTFK